MLRGLAGLPWRTPVIAADRLVQIASVDDVAATVAWGLGPEAKVRAILDIMHPDHYTIGHIVEEQRRWLGFAPHPIWNLPAPLAAVVAAGADALGWLGWRSPARSNSFLQLAAGTAGDPAAWIAATGIHPKSLRDIFTAHPATIQDRWFARLYCLKPAAIACLSAFFLVSGVISLRPGWSEGMAVLAPAQLPEGAVAGAIMGGAALDIVLGLALLVRRTARISLVAMLALSLVYLVVATALNPALWADPFGRLLKTVPIMFLILFTLAVMDER